MKYKILGCNDEQTDCDCCGRSGLKRTVVLERHTEHDYDIIRVGVDCASILLARQGIRKSGAKIKQEGQAKEDEKIRAAQYLAQAINWKIENRIQPTIEQADEAYAKQYPLYPWDKYTDHDFGVLYVQDHVLPAVYAYLATKDLSDAENGFKEYLLSNFFKRYNPPF